MTTITKQIDYDTIASRATAPGLGSISVVRISGSKAYEIGHKITKKNLNNRKAYFGDFYDENNNIIDQGIAIFFKKPHSFTGEDVVELQGHGGIVVNLILKLALNYGARQSKPGEFTERAFLNNKLDLTQAEAIADLIESSSEQAARSAINSLTGAFSKKINILLEELIELRIFIEAAIDFPEEEIDFLAEHPVVQKLENLIKELNQVLLTAKQGVIQQDGLRLLIMGAPNVGKSSLMNILAGVETSIVTDIKGTTRDAIKENIQLDGIPLQIIDTAGLRDTKDKIEKIGIKKTMDLSATADLILFMIDQPMDLQLIRQHWQQLTQQQLPKTKITIIRNKIDIYNEQPQKYSIGEFPAVSICAKYEQGVDILKDHLKQQAGFTSEVGGCFSARQRHVNNLIKAKKILQQGKDNYLATHAAELLAEDLRQIQHCLGEITGVFTNEELLGRIFSSFCIGK